MLSRLFPGAVERFEDDYDTAPLRERSYQRSRGHLRRHPATRRTRWLWLVPLAAGFLTVLGWVLAHEPAPGLALSDRGWLEIGLAGALVLSYRCTAPTRPGDWSGCWANTPPWRC